MAGDIPDGHSVGIWLLVAYQLGCTPKEPQVISQETRSKLISNGGRPFGNGKVIHTISHIGRYSVDSVDTSQNWLKEQFLSEKPTIWV